MKTIKRSFVREFYCPDCHGLNTKVLVTNDGVEGFCLECGARFNPVETVTRSDLGFPKPVLGFCRACGKIIRPWELYVKSKRGILCQDCAEFVANIRFRVRKEAV